MSKQESGEVAQRTNDALDVVIPDANMSDYPKEAMPIGSYVRSGRLNRLGFITDAFYGELDKDNKNIIIYTILIGPKTDYMSKMLEQDERWYLTNEYEYEVTGFLMMNPIDVSKIMIRLDGGVYQ
tara:strand:+ start:1535 stop:1909 length:375 start_codon:yes stop_codon:yes gene_type:complete